MNKCFEISSTYKYFYDQINKPFKQSLYENGNEILQSWKFDVRKKSDIGYWFASEAEDVNKYITF